MLLALATAPVDASVDCDFQRNHVEMAECELIDYQRADVKLNQEWQLALASARKFDRENEMTIRRGQMRSLVDNLRVAQRAWITYRDAHCDAEARNYSNDGTRGLILNICLRKLTETRTQQLETFIEK
jgi:uncharacterized protein YecT (DUF1311 family)